MVGWDIGGVNIKATRLPGESTVPLRSISRPYELQRGLSGLSPSLRGVAADLGSDAADCHAVTMTAELSQAFRTKREGVRFVLEALNAAFPTTRIHVYTVSGGFVSPQEGRSRPLEVAASNWAATANWVARSFPNCILLDVGTTTTDLIPIQGGVVVAQGRTDLERLSSSELVYTGALRTPVEAIAGTVPIKDTTARLAAEGFALSGDVHLWLGRLSEGDYSCPTPDGRPATREYAGERLARAVCADREMLDDHTINRMAEALAQAQRDLLLAALGELRARFPLVSTAVVTGLGEFIATEAARAAGLHVISLGDKMTGAGQTAAATAVAFLFRQSLMAMV